MITVMFTSRVRAAMEQQGGVVVILEVIQEVKEWSTWCLTTTHYFLGYTHAAQGPAPPASESPAYHPVG